MIILKYLFMLGVFFVLTPPRFLVPMIITSLIVIPIAILLIAVFVRIAYGEWPK